MRGTVLFLMVGTLVLGCGVFDHTPSGISTLSIPTFQSLDQMSHQMQEESASVEILFVSDNQQAQVLALPIAEQSKLTEKTVNTAHRRPALDEFALSLISWIHEQETGKNSTVLIHAGDLLNNSCEGEYQQSVNTLNDLSMEWYLTPGNHDGYYLGISSPINWNSKGINFFLDERKGWGMICTNPRRKITDSYKQWNLEILDKFTFTVRYLDTLGVRNYCSEMPNNCERTSLSSSGFEGLQSKCARINNQVNESLGSRKSLNRVCWTELDSDTQMYVRNDDGEGGLIDREPWRHFVLQLIAVPIGLEDKNTNVLIIDTASYVTGKSVNKEGEFKLNTNFGAADTASFTEPQYKLALEMAMESDIELIVGHHPLEDFDPESRARLVELIEKMGGQNIYVSGDTHDGFDVIHHEKRDSKIKATIREVNLGAIIDAPVEYATLGLTKKGKIGLHRYMMTPMGKNHDWRKPYKTSKFSTDQKGRGLERLPKIYAEQASTWEMCGNNFKPFFMSEGSTSDPLDTGAKWVFPSTMFLKQSGDWPYLGVPYLLHSAKDVRHLSLMVYKINRLMQLANVYRQLIKNEGGLNGNSSTHIDILEKKAVEEIQWVRENNFKIYSKGRYALNSSLTKLVTLIEGYRSLELDSHQAELFKVCAALYEAEREYK